MEVSRPERASVGSCKSLKGQSRLLLTLGSNQKGSVLVAGIIILGVFAVLLAAGVRQEGSAQALNIVISHRREAQDLARGGIDQLLYELRSIDNPADWTPVGKSDPQGGWSTKLAAEPKGKTLTLRSTATVSGVLKRMKPGGCLKICSGRRR